MEKRKRRGKSKLIGNLRSAIARTLNSNVLRDHVNGWWANLKVTGPSCMGRCCSSWFLPYGTIFFSLCEHIHLHFRWILPIWKYRGYLPNYKAVWWVEDTRYMGGVMPPLGAQQAQQTSPVSGNAVNSVDFLAISKTPGPDAPLWYKVATQRKPWLYSRCGEKKGKWIERAQDGSSTLFMASTLIWTMHSCIQLIIFIEYPPYISTIWDIRCAPMTS